MLGSGSPRVLIKPFRPSFLRPYVLSRSVTSSSSATPGLPRWALLRASLPVQMQESLKRNCLCNTYYIEAKWPKAAIFFSSSRKINAITYVRKISEPHNQASWQPEDNIKKQQSQKWNTNCGEVTSIASFLITPRTLQGSVWVYDKLKMETCWLYETTSVRKFTRNCCVRYCLCHCYLPKANITRLVR